MPCSRLRSLVTIAAAVATLAVLATVSVADAQAEPIYFWNNIAMNMGGSTTNLAARVIRPRRILTTVDGSAYLGRLRWRHWGHPRATARGISKSTTSSYHARVTLSSRGRFEHHRVYRCITQAVRHLGWTIQESCLGLVGPYWAMTENMSAGRELVAWRVAAHHSRVSLLAPHRMAGDLFFGRLTVSQYDSSTGCQVVGTTYTHFSRLVSVSEAPVTGTGCSNLGAVSLAGTTTIDDVTAQLYRCNGTGPVCAATWELNGTRVSFSWSHLRRSKALRMARSMRPVS